MFKNTQKREKFALSLMQAGLGQEIVCKATGISNYEYQRLVKQSKPLLSEVA